MAITLDAKELALVDQEFPIANRLWDILTIGAKEVWINKVNGIGAKVYKHNGKSAGAKVFMTKQTKKENIKMNTVDALIDGIEG